jgi:hypothetical protein
MLAQVQTDAPMHFNKPYILVTRVGENNTNDTYHNPRQRYYEHDSMSALFKHAARIGSNEKPVSALRVLSPDHIDQNEWNTATDYFHNFPVALDEYKRGIRVEM